MKLVERYDELIAESGNTFAPYPSKVPFIEPIRLFVSGDLLNLCWKLLGPLKP